MIQEDTTDQSKMTKTEKKLTLCQIHSTSRSSGKLLVVQARLFLKALDVNVAVWSTVAKKHCSHFH